MADPKPMKELFGKVDFDVYPSWSAEAVLNALHIEPDETKTDAERRLADAEEACLLKPAAFEACRKAGYVFP